MNTTFEIEKVILRRVTVPLVEPFRISNGSVSEKESVVIELHSEGFVAYGEGSPMSGSFYSSETPETTWQALSTDLVPDILSRNIESPVGYADVPYEYGKEPFACAGIEGAVWHLCALRLHTTISALFGAPAGQIPSGLAVGIYDSTHELVSRIAHYLEDGYQRVKIKIMPGWDIEPLLAVRKRFPKIPLMVDANAAYNLADHKELLQSLDQFDLMMIEQPLAAEGLEDMGTLARAMKTPLCVDESADSMDRLEEIIRHESASIVNIKVQRVGGLWNATRMLERAREAGLECWLGTMPELGIASAQALSIATLPGFVYPTDIEASSRWFVDDIVAPAITISRKGYIAIPNRGAMNYDVDRVKMEQYTTESKEFSR